MKGTTTDFCIYCIYLFVLISLGPVLHDRFGPDVSDCRRLSGRSHSYRTVDDEPTTIARMSHDIPDGRTEGKIAPGRGNETASTTIQRSERREVLRCFRSEQLSQFASVFLFFFSSLGTKDVSRAGVPPPFGGLRETQTNLADAVVPCWLDSPCCDLNLFCLDYKVPSGQLMHLKGTS